MDQTNEPAIPSSGEPGAQPGLKHSGPGIAAFVIAAASLLLTAFSFIAMFSIGPEITEGIVSGTITGEQALAAGPQLVIGPLLMMIAVLASIVGLILGIVGLAMPKRKKIFALLGTILNGLYLLLLAFLTIVGMLLMG